MNESLKKQIPPELCKDFHFEKICEIYKERYKHKSEKDQRGDILLYGLLIAAIDNIEADIPVSMHRLAEITFSELEEVQEHLPVILEIYPDIGHYYVEQQTFVKNKYPSSK